MASMPNSSKTCSRMRAPARMMSARRGSSPGSFALAATVGALTRDLTTASRSWRESSKLFQVRGGACSRRAGLLGAGDDLDIHARLGPRPLEEHGTVLGLAHRAGRHRRQARSVDVGHLTEAGQHRDPTIDGPLVEVLHVAAARTEANHLLLV